MSNTTHPESPERFLFLPFSHIPILIGLSYFFGFVVIAFRLENYGIAPTDLFEGQYLSAGAFPCLFVFTIYWIFRLTWRPHESSEKLRNFLRYVSQILIPLGAVAVGLFWFTNRIYENAALFSMGYIASIAYGLFALGIFSYQLRKWWTKADEPWFFYRVKPSQGQSQMIKAFFLGFNIIYLVGFLIFAAFEVSNIYGQIPQALGGGKLVRIQLILDTASIPPNLKENDITASTSYTKPLWLVFRSQQGYVVVDEENHPWMFPSNDVHAFTTVMEPEVLQP